MNSNSTPNPNTLPVEAPNLTGLRVAFLTHYTELYGANMSLLNLLEGLRAMGVQAHVIAPEPGELLDVLANRKIPAAVIPFEWCVSTGRTPENVARRVIGNVRHVHKIARQIERWNCDLVYSNSSVFAVGALAAARLDRPHVWHLREFGFRDYDLRPDLGWQYTRLLLQSADAVLIVSEALRKAFLGSTRPANARVIYNGVAHEAEFDQRRKKAEELRNRKQPFTFVLVGRFRESKGQAVAIQAFSRVLAKHPDVRLLMVGGSGNTGHQEYYDSCRQLADQLQLGDKIEFWGYIPDPERAFLTADVALMCSRNEAMGRVTVEAMSACRPVIGYASGGTRELIQPEKTGLLYHGGPENLAESMIRYVTQPELAREHGAAAWEYARRAHSIEVYARQIASVLGQIPRRR